MYIRPASSIRGNLLLPGDKSISHRAAIMAALAEGTTRIENFAPGADCASTLSCLKQLGVKIEREENTVIIHGVGKHGLQAPAEPLDCGNSGTTMRLMAGVLAGQNFMSTLTGDESLSSRPMQRVIEPLTQMGAEIESIEGHAPLTIHSKGRLKAIDYALPKPSAQLKGCVLLAGLFADGTTTVKESVSTRNHTERMLPYFGIEVGLENKAKDTFISLSGEAKLAAKDMTVPGDVSSAAFFMVAAACLRGSQLTLRNLNLNYSRLSIITLLQTLGTDIRTDKEDHNGPEDACEVSVVYKQLRREEINISGSITAALIDEIPVLAVLGTQLEQGLEIRDAQELRIKESDRIKSVVQNLRTMGAVVEEFPDGLRVEKSQLKGAKIDSFGDHRIAMAFAVAGLLAEGETEITGSECVDISYPDFFEALADLSK
jgi:3-phosphoshikimate 1-carboxyvinyltransferase